jgi:DNA-binding NtrC family response regulator
LAEQGVIGVEHLGLPAAPKTGDESLRLEDWEARLIRQALQRTEGKVPEAAEMLGISRATLYRKLETYHIERS